jgi:hypothetical protein
MKFFSKYSNFRIVLKHGIPGEPLVGRPSIPGMYVKFEAGEVDVKQQEVIDLLLAHPRFGTDFVAEEIDPFAKTRKGLEPQHDTVEIQFGHIGVNSNPRQKGQEQKEMITAMAKELAVPLAKEMAKEMARSIMAEMSAAPAPKTLPAEDDIVIPDEVIVESAPEKTTVKTEAKTDKK